MARRDSTKEREYRQRYYTTHKDELLKKQSAYQKARLLGPEGDHVRVLRRTRVIMSRKRLPEQWKKWNRESRERLKADMFAAYGDSCACCGERAPAFLTLDHVNRDGNVHRAKLGGRNVASPRQILLDLKRQGWPKEGYRVLCINCNFATRFGALCPHLLRADTHLAFVEVA